MTLDVQPTLVGPTLTLRPLTAADHDALAEAASDPLIWEQHPADRHERAQFEAFFADALASGGALVARTRDGRVVGTSRFHGYDAAASCLEIGWTFLVRDLWGGPANRELKTLMLDHAFTAVERVHFLVAPANHRSQAAVTKLGARRRDEAAPDGSVLFELTRDVWEMRPDAR